MNPKDLRDAIAARAAGEDLPGLDPADLDARLAADPALRTELDDLARLCAALRGAPVPAAPPAEGAGHRPPASPREAPISSIRLPARRFPWRIAVLASAAAALIAATVIIEGRGGRQPPAPPPIADGAAPPAAVEALEMLREPLPGEKGPREIRYGGGGGPGSPLGPVLAQVGFAVRLPADLPKDFDLEEARIRRAAVAGKDAVRLVWEGSRARLVLVEAPAAPGVREALGRAKPPEGAVARIVEVEGTVILIGAAGVPGDRLEAMAAGLR